MQTGDAHVTARLHRTADGEVHREYVVGDIAYGSLSALQRALSDD